ncbi:MAG: ABC transporter permease [Candidatus Shapirobacteria bacterium]
MNYNELISSAIGALRGNILRTLLTMLGIIIGIASVILIISLGQGATASITGQLSSFGTNTVFILPGSSGSGQGPRQNQTDTLKLEDVEALADKSRLQNISAVSGVASKPLQVSANGQTVNATVQGVGSDYSTIQSLEINQGEFFSNDDEISLSRVAVIGADVVADLFGEEAEPVGESIKLDNKSFRVIGVLQEKDSSAFSNPNKGVYIPVNTAMKILLGQDYVSQILIQVENGELVNQTVNDITSLLVDQHDIIEGANNDFSVNSAQQALDTVGSVTGLLTALLSGIAAISLVVGGIGIMNIMLVTVTERTREIGLLKSIGARDGDILTQFLIEAIVLTLVGGLIGMSLGIGLSFLISGLIDIPFVVSLSSILLAVGVSSVVGVVFGYYPAQRAAKLLPIEALRYE